MRRLPKSPEFKFAFLYKGEPRVSSRDLAEALGYSHKGIKKIVYKYRDRFEKRGKLYTVNFGPFVGPKKRGRPPEQILFNDEHFIFLCTLLENTPITVELKDRISWEYCELKKRKTDVTAIKQDPEYQKIRLEGKVVRREFTDVIKELREYAKKQGSTGYKWLYKNYTTMMNNALFDFNGNFDNNREFMTEEQLRTIEMAERIAAQTILKSMAENMPYKDIFKLTKKKIHAFAELYGKTTVVAGLPDSPKALEA